MQSGRTEPIQVEVIAHILQGIGLCASCELVMAGIEPLERARAQVLAEYPSEWQEDWRRLSAWVNDLAGRYGGGILIRVIDPRSPQGLLKSVRHRIRRYPTWVVDRRTRIVGWDRPALEAALEHALEG